jgi:DNA-binding transcriptional regulator YiaG
VNGNILHCTIRAGLQVECARQSLNREIQQLLEDEWLGRRDSIPDTQIQSERTSLSQSEFARLIGVSVKTLQNWEQDRRRPTGPAAALLRIIAHEPRLAVEAIHRP